MLYANIGVWRSLGARLIWDQEVAGSNPVTPTIANFLVKKKSGMPIPQYYKIAKKKNKNNLVL